jgi:hypothetical protein
MPLHLNLYHEIETQKAFSRRDPLKIAGYVLGTITVIFAAMYLWELGRSGTLNSELARRKAEFDKIDPKAREADKREKALQHTFEISGRLVKSIEGRFYWAPVLEDLVKIVPREVQLTKLTGSVQGDSAKKTQLNLDGIAAGTDPRRVAEDLRQSLVETLGKRYKNVVGNFRQLEEGAGNVTLDGQSLPSATFIIVLTMQSGEEAPATPAPSERRKR